MSYIIRAIAFANGTPCPFAGQFVKSFDFEFGRGRGYGTFTPDPKQALSFTTAGDALTFWRTTSTDYPVREDGRPNRPLTSTTCEIVNLTTNGD